MLWYKLTMLSDAPSLTCTLPCTQKYKNIANSFDYKLLKQIFFNNVMVYNTVPNSTDIINQLSISDMIVLICTVHSMLQDGEDILLRLLVH